jgi:hypothetical protein
VPADSLIIIVLALAVFGFFMTLLIYADYTENRRPRVVPARPDRKRYAVVPEHRQEAPTRKAA